MFKQEQLPCDGPLVQLLLSKEVTKGWKKLKTQRSRPVSRWVLMLLVSFQPDGKAQGKPCK